MELAPSQAACATSEVAYLIPDFLVSSTNLLENTRGLPTCPSLAVQQQVASGKCIYEYDMFGFHFDLLPPFLYPTD